MTSNDRHDPAAAITAIPELAERDRLLAQIAELQAQADQLQVRGLARARQIVAHLMAEHNVKPEDIVAAAEARQHKRKFANAGCARYRDPASGKTWTGFGREPGWMAGKDRGQFVIDASAPA